MTKQAGVAVDEHGGAIVVTEHGADALRVVRITSYPFDMGALAAAVHALDDETQAVVDGDGLGAALWQVVVPEDRLVREQIASRSSLKDEVPRLWLYQGRGTDRQALVNNLVVVVTQDVLRFAADLPELATMQAAMAKYRRQVQADGGLGSTLVTALALSLADRLEPIRHRAFFVNMR